jgi:1-deoxy-D-xylulose 5-phosphate reductoisomerase
MLKIRSVALSFTVATFAVLGAGCQNAAEHAPPAAATGRAAADNTAEICDSFRNFEVDHRDKPAPAKAGDSLTSFNTIAAADMKELAARATDPTVSAQLKAITAQVSILADQESGKTYDQVELANPEVFAAGGKAWVALEGRCGKAVIPSP